MRVIKLAPNAVVAVTLAAGCLETPSAPPPPTADWFPATAGRAWSFERKRGPETSRAIFRLEASERGDSTTFALVAENPVKGTSQRGRLLKEGENVTIFWGTGPFHLLRPPLEPGRTWTWQEGNRRTDATVVGIETLEVAGRPTSCLHVRYETVGGETSHYWFARGVGWIRIETAAPGSALDSCALTSSVPP